MKLLRGFGVWMLAGAVALALCVAARAQSGQGNSGSGGSYGGGVYNAGQGGLGGGQSGSGTGMGRSGSGTGGVSPSAVPDIGNIDVPQNRDQMEQQQAKARNAERQKQLVADTQKLVALANELQDDVNKSTKDTLSLDVVRKADEIEKLAKNVRDRMKNAN